MHSSSEAGDQPGPVATRLEEKLRAAFAPTELNIINQSDLHAGHAGSPGTGESHFRVMIVAETFAGMGRLARQRAVMDVLSEELAGPVHALSVEAKPPA